MKSISLPFTVLLASAVAAPLLPTDSGLTPTHSARQLLAPTDVIADSGPTLPREGFVPVDLLEEACLKMCPAVIPGLHPYKQAGTFSCRLHCGADAYRRSRQGKAEEDKEKDRAVGSSREQVAPHELDALLLKKHRFWNTTGIEIRSGDELASLFADGGENDKRPVPAMQKGNPCAWPSEWDGSRASKREMYVCLESCPVGSFSGVCLPPCFDEITERRCREKRAKETKPKGGEHSAAEAALNAA